MGVNDLSLLNFSSFGKLLSFSTLRAEKERSISLNNFYQFLFCKQEFAGRSYFIGTWYLVEGIGI
jgi:hypothetical protein